MFSVVSKVLLGNRHVSGCSLTPVRKAHPQVTMKTTKFLWFSDSLDMAWCVQKAKK